MQFPTIDSRRSTWPARVGIAGIIAVATVGCARTTTTQISVWQAPKIESAAGRTVRLASIAGPPAVANSLSDAIAAQQATGVDRRVQILKPDEPLADKPTIQLASATEPFESPREVAAYELRGEVLPPPTSAIRRAGQLAADSIDPIAMTWRLIELDETSGKSVRTVGGEAIRVEPKPPAAGIAMPMGQSTQDRLIRDAADAVYGLVVPSVGEVNVLLIEPRGPGVAKSVRQGNAGGDAGKLVGRERDLPTNSAGPSAKRRRNAQRGSRRRGETRLFRRPPADSFRDAIAPPRYDATHDGVD